MSMRDVQYAWVRRQLGPQGKLVDPLEREVLRLRWGLDRPGPPKPRTTDEVAELLKLTPSQVFVIERTVVLRPPDRMPGL